jgi:hypothetical protein
MRNSIVVPAASGLFGLAALIGLAAMPAHALEPISPPKTPCEECLARCPPGQNTCRLHCNVYQCDITSARAGTIFQRPDGAASPWKGRPAAAADCAGAVTASCAQVTGGDLVP